MLDGDLSSKEYSSIFIDVHSLINGEEYRLDIIKRIPKLSNYFNVYLWQERGLKNLFRKYRRLLELSEFDFGEIIKLKKEDLGIVLKLKESLLFTDREELLEYFKKDSVRLDILKRSKFAADFYHTDDIEIVEFEDRYEL